MSTELPKVYPSAPVMGLAAPHRMPSGERKEQLIAVAMKLFARKGFRGTTTKEIAKAAGVNQAILFRHFASKDELYAAILDHKARKSNSAAWIEELRAIAERRDDEVLFRVVIEKTLEHGRRDQDFTRLMLFSALEGHKLAQSFRDKRIRPVFKFLCDYIALRQKEGTFRAVEPAVVVRAIFGIPSYHSQVVSLFNCRLLTLKDEEAARKFAELILMGLKKTSGTKKIIKRSNGSSANPDLRG
ncbi:MAG: TetR/AcrR family transcriptional regulator [Candidatus Udaeobacter sp.]